MSNSVNRTNIVGTLADNITTASFTSTSVSCFSDYPRTLQASLSTAGSATVKWYGSNTSAPTGGVLLATMAVTGSGDAAGTIVTGWGFIYCVISGNSSKVTATVGF